MTQLFTQELLDRAIMSPSVAHAAEQGKCPGCGAYDLHPLRNAEIDALPWIYLGCATCRHMVVLGTK